MADTGLLDQLQAQAQPIQQPTADQPVPDQSNDGTQPLLDQLQTQAQGKVTDNETPYIDFAGTQQRNLLSDRMSDPDFMDNLQAKNQAVNILSKMLPNVDRQQIIDNLPNFVQSFTGRPAEDKTSFFNGVASTFDAAWQQFNSQASRWAQFKSQNMVEGFRGALDLLGVNNPNIQAIETQGEINAVQSEKGVQSELQAAGMAAEKSQAFDQNWWYPATNLAAQVAAGGVKVGQETALGALVAGPEGAQIGASDAMGAMMGAQVFGKMVDKGVDPQQADASAELTRVLVATAAGGGGKLSEAALPEIVAKGSVAAIPILTKIFGQALAEKIAPTALGVGAGTAAATVDMTAQQAVADQTEASGEQAYNERFGKDYETRVEKYLDAISQAKKALGDQILQYANEYNQTALVKLDNPQDRINSLLDMAGSTALATLLTAGLGGLAHGGYETIKGWNKEGKLPENIQAAAQNLQAEHAIQTAEPQPNADVSGTKVVDTDGKPIAVYHAADQALAAGHIDLDKMSGPGLAFHEDPARAEDDARGQSEGPLQPTEFLAALKEKYPGAVADAAEAVMKNGREAAEPFEAQLKTFQDSQPAGTFDVNHILDLAQSIHDGTPVEDRNALVKNYGLDRALPAGGIIEAHIQADKVAHVDYQSEIPQAFKDGAQAVEHDGTWYVRDAKNVVVTGKHEVPAEAPAEKPEPETGLHELQDKLADTVPVDKIPETMDKILAESEKTGEHPEQIVDRVVNGGPLENPLTENLVSEQEKQYVNLHEPGQGKFDFNGPQANGAGRGPGARSDSGRSGNGGGVPPSGSGADSQQGLGRDDSKVPSTVRKSGKDYWRFKSLEQAKTVDIIGKKVPDFRSDHGALSKDAATGFYNVVKIYRDRRYETFRFVFVADDGTIKDHIAVSSRHPRAAEIIPAGVDELTHLEMVRKMAEGSGTRAVMVHNHPSGDVSPSPEDMAVTAHVAGILGDRFAGHIILDHGEFASSRDVRGSHISGKVSFDKMTLPVKGRDATLTSGKIPGWFGTEADPRSIATLAQYVDRDADSIPLFMASARGKMTAVHYVPRAIWSGPEITTHLVETHRNTGTTMAFPVVTDRSDMARAKELHSSGLVMDIVDATNPNSVKALGRQGGSALSMINAKADSAYVQEDEKTYPDRESFLDEQDARITQNEKTIADYEKAAPKLLEKQGKGKSFDERDEINKQIQSYIKAKKDANAADRANLEALRESPGPTRDQAEHDAIKDAVSRGEAVPDGYLTKYAGEDWADAEIHHREDLRDQTDHAKAFDHIEDYLKSIQEDRELMALGDPFSFEGTEEEWAEKEAKAKSEAVLTPEDHERFSQVYAIAHAKTPEELDANFKASLNPDKVKNLLAGMAQEGYVSDKGLPRHVTAQVLKSREGGTTKESEISRIQKTMENDPRTYRRIEQQIRGDLSELAHLAMEDRIEKAIRPAEELPPEVKPIELPSEMSIEDKAAIRMGTRSRAEWQRKALDAKAEAGELNRALTMLENLSGKWAKKTEDAKSIEDDLDRVAKEAKVGGAELTRLTSKLRDLRNEDPTATTATKDRAVSLISELTSQIKTALKAKEADRKAFKQVRDQMRAMGEYIAKPTPKTIHVAEAKQIENMRSLVDPNFRTKAKAQALADRARWFQEHPEAKMTDKLKREVFARNLNDWDYEDLHNLYTERKALEDVGRDHLRAKKEAWAQDVADRRQRIIRAIYNDTGKLHAKMNAETDEDKRQKFAQQILEREIKRAKEAMEPMTSEALSKMKGKGKWSHLLTVSNLADYLDGGADWKGENHQLLHREVSDATNHEAENVHRRETAMLDFIKEYNKDKKPEDQIQLRRLSHFSKFDGYDRPLMGDALLDIYMKAKNDRARAAMTAVRGNNIRESIIAHVNNEPKLQWMRDLGDRIIQEYNENSDRLFDAMEEYDNIAPPREENYTPIMKEHGRTAEGDEPGFMDDMKFDIGYANEYRRAAVNRSFSHARVDVPDEYQKPIQLAGYRTWLNQVKKQEKYINMKPVSRMLEAVYGDREVEEAILHTYGGGVLDEIRDYSKHVAGNPDRDLSAPAWLSNLLNRNANIAYLAYNAASTMKQFSTLPHALPYTSPVRLMGAVANMMKNPWKMIKDIESHSVQYKTRAGSFDTLANDRVNNWGKSKWNQTMGDIGTAGHTPLTLADKLVAGVVHDAVRNTELDKGTLPSEAAARADWVVGRTQHSNRVMDATGLNRSKSGFARIFSALTGPAFKISNELTYGLGMNIKNGHYVRAIAQLTGLALGGIILTSISEWALPTAEEIPGAVASGVAKWVPILGDNLAQLLPMLWGQKPGYMHTPTSMVGQVVNDAANLGKGFEEVTQGKSDKARASGVDNLVKAGLDGFGLMTGFPSTIVTRVYKAIRTGDPAEILGAKKPKP